MSGIQIEAYQGEMKCKQLKLFSLEHAGNSKSAESVFYLGRVLETVHLNLYFAMQAIVITLSVYPFSVF